jgi:single-stranded-DNA-specific exonuclease
MPPQTSPYLLKGPLPAEVADELKEYSPLLQTLLFHRGLGTRAETRDFLQPDFEAHMHDPFLMADMEKAVERIMQAIEKNERILIYSDYDADGIPAAVIMSDFFELIHYTNVEVYIPHRHKEGYGLHQEAIESFKDRVKLIITLDCGIVDRDEVAHANAYGIDVIITDHHMPHGDLPQAYAILNSKRSDCMYPYKMLCGAGVAFKLVQALITRIKKMPNEDREKNIDTAGSAAEDRASSSVDIKPGAEKWLLDMAGIATLSDMVPLRGENRVMALYGLKVLRKSRRPGLQKLLSILSIPQATLTEDDVAFMITPRINAASRMAVPIDAYHVFATKDPVAASGMAKHLDSINQERKVLVAVLVKEVKKRIDERREYFEHVSVIVLGNPEWRPALLGLVASSLVEEYNKPVFLWGREDGVELKGSCRSNGVVSVVDVMEVAQKKSAQKNQGDAANKDAKNDAQKNAENSEKSSTVFTHFGGHTMSGGFSVDADHIHHLPEILNESFAQLERDGKTVAAKNEQKYVDALLTLEEVNAATHRIVDQLAPFGIDNPKPLFLFKKVTPESVRMFGKRPEHLELSFATARGSVKAIAFFAKPEDFPVAPNVGAACDLVATIEKSFFRGRTEIRLRIVDIV